MVHGQGNEVSHIKLLHFNLEIKHPDLIPLHKGGEASCGRKKIHRCIVLPHGIQTFLLKRTSCSKGPKKKKGQRQAKMLIA